MTKYDIYFWRFPKANKLIKMENVPEEQVSVYTNAWLDKYEDSDCMIVAEDDEFVATNECIVTLATDAWIKQNLTV